jgi:replication-associated recombination protein RarA
MGLTQQLTEKYRPHRINDFVGLAGPKKILSNFVKSPYGSAWLFVGGPGTGKSTMALALAEELGLTAADITHIPSQTCTVETVKNVSHEYFRAAMWFSKCHRFMYLIDEIDAAHESAKTAWLSLLDPQSLPPRCILIFTCNEVEYDPDDNPPENIKDRINLPRRLIERCQVLAFNNYGQSAELKRLLEHIWSQEAPPDVKPPNFSKLVKEHSNVRAALMEVQKRLLAL